MTTKKKLDSGRFTNHDSSFKDSVIDIPVAYRFSADGGLGTSVITLHFFAGTVAGALFTVRALLVLAALILVECVAAAFWLGTTAALLGLGSLVAIQVGYLAGVGGRAVLEHKKLAGPLVRPRHRH